jgi:diguanylate cyclase (GGDEF)-like protein/PAS domain S-box-containing protein
MRRVTPSGELSSARLGRMFAALSASNEALLRASSPEALYQQVCDAAVYGGKFLSATVLLSEPASVWAAVAATTGAKRTQLQARIAIDESIPEGRGLVGQAFRTGVSCTSNHYLDDPRMQPWHELARQKQVASAAAVPLHDGARVAGVLLFLAGELDAFDDEVVGWLERMSANVTHALASFEREQERQRSESALRESQARFRSLVELSADWFWACDAEFRLLGFEGRVMDESYQDRSAILGKRLWEFPGVVAESADFEGLRALTQRRESFRDFEYAFRDRQGQLRYTSVSGEPALDGAGVFVGHHGTWRDVTQRKRSEALVALEHAVTRSLAGADSSRTVLQAVMRVVCESEQWDTAGYFRVEDEAGTTRLVIGWRLAGTDAATTEYYKGAAHAVIPPGGLLSKVVRSGKPMWFANLLEVDTTWRQRVERTGEKATFSFPVLVDAKVIGVLAFSSREIREPDERLLQTVRVIGEQVGQFMQRKQAEQEMRASEARFRALTDLSSDWYWEIGPDFCFTRIEGRHVEGGESLASESVLGKRRWETKLDIEDPGGWDAHHALLQAQQPFRDVVMVRASPGGAQRYLSVSGEPMYDHKRVFQGYRGIGRDITGHKLAQNRIQHLATHDGLTGLPNRVMFSELLGLAIQAGERYEHGFAVLFIDLDGFKHINDTLGHAAGDALLKEVSLRLSGCLRSNDVVARLGGDEFIVLVQQVGGPDEAARVARKILDAVARPMQTAARECRVTASIGISVYPSDARDEQSLMRTADMAMYLAKQDGKNKFQFHSVELRPSAALPD